MNDHKFIIVLLALFLVSSYHTTIDAQENEPKNIMVELKYQTEQSSKIDLIHNTLNDLENIETDTPYFNDIIWINSLKTKHLKLRGILDDFDPRTSLSVSLSPEELSYSDTILQKISNIDYWLEINIEGDRNSNQNFIFKLYHAKRGFINYDERVFIYPQISIGKAYKIVSNFYEFNSSSNLLLKNTVIKLFKEFANNPPELNVSVNKKPYIKNDTIVMTLGDSILIDLSNSDDLETERNQFQYSWKQLSMQGRINPPEEMELNLTPNVSKQYIRPKKAGLYHIKTNVDDGIQLSTPISIYFQVINKPILALSKHKYSNYNRISYFQYLFNLKKFNSSVDDAIIAELKNYPNQKWELSLINTKRNWAGILFNPKNPDINLKKTEGENYTKNINVKGKIKRGESLKFYFEGTYKNQKSNIVEYKIQKPYCSLIEEINIGTLPLYISVLRRDSVLKNIPVLPIGAEINVPLFYREGHNNYTALIIGFYPYLLNRKSIKNGDWGLVKLGLRESIGSPNKRHSMYFELSFVALLTNSKNRDLYQISTTPYGYKWDYKYISFSLELLNVNFNINPFDIVLGAGFKINLIEWSNSITMKEF